MMETISLEDQQILDSLQKTVTEVLERKKRLGHYAVIWQDGRPVIIGGENTDDKLSPMPKKHQSHPDIAGIG
ncbi:MAG: kelch motif-containing protein [Magnetococcus sp. THC-1_WYH]